MGSVEPIDVTSPKAKIKDLEVIINKAKHDEGSYSVSIMKWNNNKDEIGIRWDGNDNSVGIPQSRGYATWFILPEEIAILYMEKLLEKRNFPDDKLSERIKKYIEDNSHHK